MDSFAEMVGVFTLIALAIILFILSCMVVPDYSNQIDILEKELDNQNILIKCYENPNIPNKDVCRTLIKKDKNNE